MVLTDLGCCLLRWVRSWPILTAQVSMAIFPRPACEQGLPSSGLTTTGPQQQDREASAWHLPTQGVHPARLPAQVRAPAQTSTGAGLRAPSIFSVLSEGRDLAEHTLRLLPLESLASLSRTCKSLRASVAAAATAWQAAAAQAFASTHPVHRASNICQYLQLQGSIRSNIATCCHATAQHEFPAPERCATVAQPATGAL